MHVNNLLYFYLAGALAIHLETEGMESGAAPQNPYLFSLGINTPDNAKNKAYKNSTGPCVGKR
jgi:hypothetical protein